MIYKQKESMKKTTGTTKTKKQVVRSEHAQQNRMLALTKEIADKLKEIYRIQRNHYNQIPTDKAKAEYEAVCRKANSVLQDLSSGVARLTEEGRFSKHQAVVVRVIKEKQ